MADDLIFDRTFLALTGNAPFPWQRAMYREMVEGRPPRSCQIPTGLGRTSVMAIWLIALAERPEVVPRRLVYVVNRRTVVDQSTAEAVIYRERLLDPLREAKRPEDGEVLARLSSSLRRLTAFPEEPTHEPLAISTLRGQFADNREWSADPCRPAIMAGTVDMIGSRLLFSGYGIGFKLKPLHAGFLGQDVLLVHDEAHLEPAFQRLLKAIQDEQERCGEFHKFHVMEMSATSSEEDGNEPFGLTPDEKAGMFQSVRMRIQARKALVLHEIEGEKDLADQLRRLAMAHEDARRAVLIFVRRVEDVEKIFRRLPEGRRQQLTGTLRGLERDRPATEDPIFGSFLPGAPRLEQTVYLICTSAGEVGVNLSGDHLVCDLTTFESMAQRFGRVNRFGSRDDTRIDVVRPIKLDEADDYQSRLKKTLDLLRKLDGDASPAALADLPARERRAAFGPEPAFLPVSDIVFDAWALTSIRGKLPGRPPVEPYLHGIEDEKAAETRVAWRDEVGVLHRVFGDQEDREGLETYAADLLEDYPLKPHEMLRDRGYRVFERLAALSKRHPEESAWLLDEEGTVQVLALRDLADKDRKDRINHRTVILPTGVGGLNGGMLTGDPDDPADDVADRWLDGTGNQRRVRIRSDDSTPPVQEGMRLIRTIDARPGEDVDDIDDEETEGGITQGRFWFWYVRPRSADDDLSQTSVESVAWDDHTIDVVRNARGMLRGLSLSEEEKEAVVLAARFHDLGKKRLVWQRSIGNPDPRNWLAKSGRRMKPVELSEYRHEFGSLLDASAHPEFQGLSDDIKDLVLHLIAVHHGFGRPHFPEKHAFDPEPGGTDVDAIAAEVPGRFVRLQRKYGRWGLAYLESLLRAADYAASAEPSRTMGVQP